MLQIAILPAELDFYGGSGAPSGNPQWNRIGILIDNNCRIESPRPALRVSLGGGALQLVGAPWGNP
jgi:hypothetical protein